MNQTSQNNVENNEESSAGQYNVDELERNTELEGNTDYRGIAGKASLNSSKEQNRPQAQEKDSDSENPLIRGI